MWETSPGHRRLPREVKIREILLAGSCQTKQWRALSLLLLPSPYLFKLLIRLSMNSNEVSVYASFFCDENAWRTNEGLLEGSQSKAMAKTRLQSKAKALLKGATPASQSSGSGGKHKRAQSTTEPTPQPNAKKGKIDSTKCASRSARQAPNAQPVSTRSTRQRASKDVTMSEQANAGPPRLTLSDEDAMPAVLPASSMDAPRASGSSTGRTRNTSSGRAPSTGKGKRPIKRTIIADDPFETDTEGNVSENSSADGRDSATSEDEDGAPRSDSDDDLGGHGDEDLQAIFAAEQASWNDANASAKGKGKAIAVPKVAVRRASRRTKDGSANTYRSILDHLDVDSGSEFALEDKDEDEDDPMSVDEEDEEEAKEWANMLAARAARAKNKAPARTATAREQLEQAVWIESAGADVAGPSNVVRTPIQQAAQPTPVVLGLAPAVNVTPNPVPVSPSHQYPHSVFGNHHEAQDERLTLLNPPPNVSPHAPPNVLPHAPHPVVQHAPPTTAAQEQHLAQAPALPVQHAQVPVPNQVQQALAPQNVAPVPTDHVPPPAFLAVAPSPPPVPNVLPPYAYTIVPNPTGGPPPLNPQHVHVRQTVREAIPRLELVLAVKHAFADSFIASQFIGATLVTSADLLGFTGLGTRLRNPQNPDFKRALITITKQRISTFRSAIKKYADAHSVAHYNLSAKNSPDLIRFLFLHLTYIYPYVEQDGNRTVPWTKPYLNDCVIAVLRSAFFSGTNSFVMQHEDVFTSSSAQRPAEHEVPMVMLALVGTAIHSSLSDWKLGVHKPTEHLILLNGIKTQNPRAYHTMMHRIYKLASGTEPSLSASALAPGAALAQVNVQDMDVDSD
ncbi:hypothetical protein BD309DRAFT_984915 [Dichomitus squalens]|nr:hypothetical protein BD309DRAFT_984915 [Dichomitus squalens]